MNLLLDTHIFIWWALEPEKMPLYFLRLCEDKSNQLYLSIVSILEIQIKMQLGKISLNKNLQDIVSEQIEINDIKILPLALPHIFELQKLPLIHKDPFDRLIVAQARTEKIQILTSDYIIKNYEVDFVSP
jgi:PIN domain nuclease of toxin-antitoxin system